MAKKCLIEKGQQQFNLHIRTYHTKDNRELKVAVPQCAQASIEGVITCSYVSIGDGRELPDQYGDCLYQDKRVQTIRFHPVN